MERKRGRPPKNANQENSQGLQDSKHQGNFTDKESGGQEIASHQSQPSGEKEMISFGDAAKIKFRVSLDGSAVKDWYHKAQPTSQGIKCEAERTDVGVLARIDDFGWWSNEMEYEGSEPIGERLVNRIGYDFGNPWEEKKNRKRQIFPDLESAIAAIAAFLRTQEKHNQQIENLPNAIQYNAPGRYQAIGV